MTSARTAGIFPGQGAQTVGMGRDLQSRFTVAVDTFAEADDVLGFPLSTVCSDGPADELKRTSIAQPALVTVCTAYWRVLQQRGLTLDAVAGHSLGEYSALVAAGALAFRDAVRLVRRRGALMEAAAERHPGSMAAIIGLGDDDVRALCAEVAETHGTLVPANYNSPGQVVISGSADAVAAARTAAKSRGAKAIPLAVSGAFHSPLMAEAAEAFAVELATVDIAVPSVPVAPNLTATLTADPGVIRDALGGQITGAVRWVDTLHALRDHGITRYVEVGPGTVLTGLLQRTFPDATSVAIADLLTD